QHNTLRRSERSIFGGLAERNDDIHAGIARGIGVPRTSWTATPGSASTSTCRSGSSRCIGFRRSSTRCSATPTTAPTTGSSPSTPCCSGSSTAASLAALSSREIDINSGCRFGQIHHHHHPNTLALQEVDDVQQPRRFETCSAARTRHLLNAAGADELVEKR